MKNLLNDHNGYAMPSTEYKFVQLVKEGVEPFEDYHENRSLDAVFEEVETGSCFYCEKIDSKKGNLFTPIWHQDDWNDYDDCIAEQE